jgi:hypothetical protein
LVRKGTRRSPPQRGDILAADVQLAQERQGGEADPDVAVKELLAGGAGVVVDGGDLDLRAPAGSGRVVANAEASVKDKS